MLVIKSLLCTVISLPYCMQCVLVSCVTHIQQIEPVPVLGASERTKNIPCSISVQSGDNLKAEQTF